MKKKKILIVTKSFFPLQSPRSFRATELVKEFARQGHDVHVLTPYTKEADLLSEKFMFTLHDLGNNKLKPLKINRSLKLLSIFERGVNRIMNLLFEYPDIAYVFFVKKKIKKFSGFDLLISIAVPHPIHWGVAASWKKNIISKKWIADCGDAYMGNDLDSFRKPFYFMFLEKWFCRKADYITIPKIEMKINFYKEFHEKFREIPQGFKIEESKIHLKPYKKNQVPTFVFAGSFIPGNRDPRNLLEFLVNQNTDFRFHIYTNTKNHVLPFLVNGEKRIILHDYIKRQDLLGILSQSDFLVNITFEPEKQIPSKLIDYLITGRPILNIDKILDIENVKNFLNNDYSGQFKKLKLDRYRIETICEKFLILGDEDSV
jgi:hypothetical protein